MRLPRAAQALGAEVILVSGPVTLPDPEGVRVVKVETAHEMLAAGRAALPADIAICAAAVADWRAADEATHKLKKQHQGGETDTEALAEPGHPRHHRRARRQASAPRHRLCRRDREPDRQRHGQAPRQGRDWIVANDVWPGTGAMGGDKTQVHLITPGGVEDWPPMSKDEMAARLLARAGEALRSVRSAAE